MGGAKDEREMELLLPDGTAVPEEARVLPDAAFDAPDAAFDGPDGADVHLSLDRTIQLPPHPPAVRPAPEPVVEEAPPAAHVVARVAFETVSPVVDLLLSIPLSLLPAVWRERFSGLSLARGTAWSGAIEAAGALGIAFYSYRRFSAVILESAGDAVLEQGSSEGQLMGLGLATMIAFVLTPLGAACAWLFGEGMVRAFAGVAAREVVGTLPLFLLERAVAAARAIHARMRMSGYVPDASRPGETPGTLMILCAQPRPWDARSTIRVDGELYALAGTPKSDDPERPHAYLLGPLPSDHLIRGVQDWTRSDLPPGPKNANTPEKAHEKAVEPKN